MIHGNHSGNVSMLIFDWADQTILFKLISQFNNAVSALLKRVFSGTAGLPTSQQASLEAFKNARIQHHLTVTQVMGRFKARFKEV